MIELKTRIDLSNGARIQSNWFDKTSEERLLEFEPHISFLVQYNVKPVNFELSLHTTHEISLNELLPINIDHIG